MYVLSPADPISGDLIAYGLRAQLEKLQQEQIMFLGWLCGELPELHQVECPRLLAAWDKFVAMRASLPREWKP
jgi:hypothetical protein